MMYRTKQGRCNALVKRDKSVCKFDAIIDGKCLRHFYMDNKEVYGAYNKRKIVGLKW